MKKNFSIFLMIVITFLLQSTFHQVLPSSLIVPNLLLILTVSMGIMRGKKSGLWVGFISGLLTDLFFGTYFGFTALIYMYIGYLNGFLFKMFFDEDFRIPMFFVGISDLVYNIIFYIVHFALQGKGGFGKFFRTTILPEAICTVIFTILFYEIYFAINKKIHAGEQEEQQSPWLRR